MSGQNRNLLFFIILGLLQGSAVSIECSLVSRPFWVISFSRFCSYPFARFQNDSEECTSVHSRRTEISDSLFENAVVYILIDLAPLMVYFPVLILFNINLTSGPGQSFLFFYQALTAALDEDYLWGFLTMQSPFNDFTSPCTLPYIALQYCKLGAVLVAIVMTVVLVKCVHCPCTSWRHPWAKLRRSVRHFREKHACKGTVLNGLCSIAILTYGFVIQQSFTVLRPANCCPSGAMYCAHYCTELNYGDYPFVLFAAGVVLSVVLALLLPLLLLYYPCVPALMQRVTNRSPQFMTCHKLAPVLDVFQSAYKPKLRFFAALPLLYRFVIGFFFFALSAALERIDRLIVITFAFIVILAIHSLVQPYSKPKHNYIETLYLVNLVLISMTWLIGHLALISRFSGPGPRLGFALIFITIPLTCLPILVCVGYFFWKRKCCKRCRASACCKRVKRNRRGTAQTEAVQATSSEVSSSEVYFDMSEVEQLNQD